MASYAVNLSSAFSTFTPREPLNSTASPGTRHLREPARRPRPDPRKTRASTPACAGRFHHGARGAAHADQQIHALPAPA